MNAGMSFQGIGGKQDLGSMMKFQPQSIDVSKGFSFKEKLDKSYNDKSTSSYQKTESKAPDKSRPDKSTDNDKVTQKPQSKDESSSQEVTDEEQNAAEAAALVQQQANLKSVETQDILQLEGEGDIMPELMIQGEGEEAVANKQVVKEGEIKLPFQNNADLAKAAMLKAQQEPSEEALKKPDVKNPLEEVEILTEEGDLVKEEKVNTLNKGEGDSQSSAKGGQDGENSEQNTGVKALYQPLDSSKFNIKVGEAPINPAKPEAAQQMADKIMYKMSEGKQEFDLELNPRSLGKINIKMIFQNGGAEIIVTTSNSKAHQLLSNHTEALRAILEGNTGNDTTINMKQAENGEKQLDRDNFNEKNQNSQNQQQQEKPKKTNQDISFIDRLRLGLVEDMEEAV